MSSPKKYHAFISYSHKDRPYATAIQKSIETLGLPFYKSWQPDVTIFRDERKIPLAGSLTEQIITGLKESEKSSFLSVIAQGVFLHPHHNWFISAAMTEADIDESLARLDRAFDSPGTP